MIEKKQVRLCKICYAQMKYFKADWYNWWECENCQCYERELI